MDKKQIFFTNIRNVSLGAVLFNLVSGSGYPAIKIGYKLFGISNQDIREIILFGGIRTAMAGGLIILGAAILNRKWIKPQKEEWKGIILLAVVLTFLQGIFCYVGLANTSGTKGSILYGMGTYFAIIFSHFYNRAEKMTWRIAAGCALGFFSVLIFSLNGAGNFNISFMGDGILLLSAVFYAIGTNMNKKTAGKMDAFVLAGYQMLLGGIMILLAAVGMGAGFKQVSGEGAGVLLYLIVSQAVTFALWTVLLKYNNVGRITIFNSLMPIFGTVLSWLILGESIFSINIILSVFCAAAGIYFVNKNEIRPNLKLAGKPYFSPEKDTDC